MADWYTFGIALMAAMGTLLFGFDTGIVTTTIAHDSWIEYMQHPSDAITGAVVALYIAGETIGSIIQTAFSDKLGRIRFMELMCVIVTIGVTLQTAAINMGMFLAGRTIAGIAVGGMVGTVPMYLSEISRPEHRGLIGGIAGAGISFGAMLANWVGFACSYAPYGAVQWRLPLATQIPWGVIMFIGLATFMPESPRQLVRAGKDGEARDALAETRRGCTAQELEAEFELMRAQIHFEMEREVGSFAEAVRLARRRVLVSIAVQTMTSLTGVNVIQYYQTTLYKSLGVGPKAILALTGVYGTVAFVCNTISLKYLMDQLGRRKLLLIGLASIIIVEIYTAVMQRQFQGTDNRVGKGFAILGIYLFGVAYYGFLNSTTWLYGAEVLPVALRAKVMGIAAASHFIVNIAVTQAGPSALSSIHENYYYVFVGCTSFFLVVAWFNFAETRYRTLEEVAEAFGDHLVPDDEREMASTTVTAAKLGAEKRHVEHAEP